MVLHLAAFIRLLLFIFNKLLRKGEKIRFRVYFRGCGKVFILFFLVFFYVIGIGNFLGVIIGGILF